MFNLRLCVAFSLLALLFHCLLLSCRVLGHGHLPRAYLPPSKNGSFWGNANRADVQLELQQLADRLLVDDSRLLTAGYSGRILVNASMHGAMPDDDWEGLNAVFRYACALSQQRLAHYRAQLPTLPSLPPAEPDSRPVLVELRFDSGRYDLAEGMEPLQQCSYLLLNGQNSTIVTHFEPGFSRHNDSSRALYDCTNCTYTYIYDYVFTTFLPGTTIGRVSRLMRDADSQQLVGLELAIIPHHTAWAADNAIMQRVGHDGGWLMFEPPVAIYGGYQGVNVTVCSSTEASSDPSGGCVQCLLPSDVADAISPFVAVSQYFGLQRGYGIPIHNLALAHTYVLQNIRSIGIGPDYIRPYWYTGTGYIDIIDVHNDRIWPDSLYVSAGQPVGQTVFSGQWRIWHFSHESDSDDLMDDLAPEADVVAVDRQSNSLTLQVAHGRWADCHNGYGGLVDDKVEVGHSDDPYNPYATLTVSDIRAFTNSSQCGNQVFFQERLPAELSVGDVVVCTTSPAHLHFKNVRVGNHAYNQWNVKARAIVMEDSFLYNSSMNGFDVSSDVGYWYEGPRANNIAIRNNVFENMAGAIGITPYMWRGPGPTDDQAAPSATHNVSITDNIVWSNETIGVLYDGWPNYPMDLEAITNLIVRNNSFYNTPGMRRDHALIRLCNVRDAVVADNHVYTAPLDPYRPGMECDGYGEQLSVENGCEPYPASHALAMMTESDNYGCRPELSWNVTVSDTNSWVEQARRDLNSAHLRFSADHFSNSKDRMNRANGLHSPPILTAVRGVEDVADFTGNSGDNTVDPVYVDLLSHWNGAVPPTDGLVLGGDDLAVSVHLMLLPPASEQLSRQTVLSIGRLSVFSWYERLDVEVALLNSSIATLHASWRHREGEENTTSVTAPASLSLGRWHVIELQMRGARYTNSTLADCAFTLYVDSLQVAQLKQQRPPLLSVPSAGQLGLSVNHDAPFTGLIHWLHIRRLNATTAPELSRKTTPPHTTSN